MTQTLFAFVGLEVATLGRRREEPDRTIPRATLVGTLITAAIYIISTAGAMSLVAPEVLMKPPSRLLMPRVCSEATGSLRWWPSVPLSRRFACSMAGSLS
jgi:APA family basic amino acid/polyamine antiporter